MAQVHVIKDKKAERVCDVEIVETLSNIVEVVAEDEQDAFMKAQAIYPIATKRLFYTQMILSTLNLISVSRIKY